MLAKLVPTGASEPLRSVGVQHVAVKKLALDGDKDDTRVPGSLAHELYLLQSLSHENIVKPIGFVEDAKDGIAWIILPWENNGNLREFIQSADWEFQERVSLLNVILNQKNKAVITDFGSGRSVDSTSRNISQFQGPSVEVARHSNAVPPKIKVVASGGTITLTGPEWVLSWAAPELQGKGVSERTGDIWAFGWICWEVLTSDFRLKGDNIIPVVFQTVEGKLPQGQGEGRPDQVIALTNLMVDCWSLDPSKRPTAKLCEIQVKRMEPKTPCNRNGSGSPEIRSSRLLTALAVEHSSHGKLEEAVGLLARATNIARPTKDGMAIAHAAHMSGAVYRSQREYSKAEESYIAARDIYARVGNQDSLADATYGLGEVYCLQDKYSKAEKAYIETRDICTRIGDRIGLANAVYGLGEAYRLRGES
ncbi:Tyrosine-protein kinase abl1, partial [Tulasnella sp. 408]